VVLLCGLAFAVLIAIFEFCYNSRRNASAERVSASTSKTEIYFNKIVGTFTLHDSTHRHRNSKSGLSQLNFQAILIEKNKKLL